MARTLALGARPVAQGKHQRAGQRPNIRRYPPDGKEWGQQGWGGGGGGAALDFKYTLTGLVLKVDCTGGEPATYYGIEWGDGPFNNLLTDAQGNGTMSHTYAAGTYTVTIWTSAEPPTVIETYIVGIVMDDPEVVLAGTIDEVKAYVNGLPDDDNRDNVIQALIDRERANRNRATLVSWLDQQTGVE